MQTNFFSSFFSQSTEQAPVDDAMQRIGAPVELDLATLEHVGGAGPAGTWAAQATTLGPAGTW